MKICIARVFKCALYYRYVERPASLWRQVAPTMTEGGNFRECFVADTGCLGGEVKIFVNDYAEIFCCRNWRNLFAFTRQLQVIV